MPTHDYSTLVAGLQKEPTFESVEEVVRKDYPLKLPNRRYIRLWNTPEISQFRGYQDELDVAESKKQVARIEREEIHHMVHDGVSAPDLTWVGDELARQRQSATAMQQHAENMADHQRRHAEGLAAEQRAEFARLSAAQVAAENRNRIAEEALFGLRDTMLEHRDRLGQLAEQRGVVYQHIDQSTVHHLVATDASTNQLAQTNIHNQAMFLMHNHATQLAAYMEAQRLNHEQMLGLIMEHLRHQPALQQQVNQQLIVDQRQLAIAQQPPRFLVPAQEAAPAAAAGAIADRSGSPPHGTIQPKRPRRPRAIRDNASLAAILDAEPVPTPDPVVPTFDMTSRGRSRSGSRPPPKNRAKSATRPAVPWTTGMAPEGAMAPTSQQKRLAEIPELQEERSSPPKAKAKSAAKAGAKADKAIAKATAKAVAKANKQKTDDNIALIMSKFESRNRSRRAASEGPVQIRKVAVDDDAEIVKRGRGRPPGSIGIKKRMMLAVAPP